MTESTNSRGNEQEAIIKTRMSSKAKETKYIVLKLKNKRVDKQVKSLYKE